MSTTEERTLKWLNDNIDFNANQTATYDEQIEQQRTAISAIETCRQLKKSLFGKENVTNDELVRMVLQLKSGRCTQKTGGRTMKTPDEIKKALKCHRDGRACHDCPYEQGRTFSVDGVTFGCSKDIVADALDYIERLEAKMEERTMSETPKCPYCGDRMEICTSLLTPELDLISAWYQCATCESTSPRIEFPGDTTNDKIKERLQAVSSRRAEPKNHVLTLEELKKHAGFLWNENRYDSFESEGEPAYAENDFLYVGDGNVDLKLNISKIYGRHWRCWLRKPTEAERREMPWAGDSRE